MRSQSISRFYRLCQDKLILVLDLKYQPTLPNFLCIFTLSNPNFEEPHFHNVLQELHSSLHSNHCKANYRLLPKQVNYNVLPLMLYSTLLLWLKYFHFRRYTQPQLKLLLQFLQRNMKDLNTYIQVQHQYCNLFLVHKLADRSDC